MGTHGQARTAMVLDSPKDGQPTKDLTDGLSARGDHGHLRRKYTDRFQGNRNFL